MTVVGGGDALIITWRLIGKMWKPNTKVIYMRLGGWTREWSLVGWRKLD